MALPFNLPLDPKAVHGGNAVHIVSVLSATLAGLVVAARLFSRVWLKRRGGGSGPGWGWDDWAVLGGALCTFAFSALVCTAWKNGLGKHAITIPPKNIFLVLKLSWLASLFNKTSTTFTKLSIFLLLLRLAKHPRALRISLITLLCAITTIGLASVLVTLFQCTPVEKAYNRTARGTCVDTGKLWRGGGGILAGTDFLVLGAAVPVVGTLWSRIPFWRSRAGVMGVLALGCFVCTAGVLRVTSLPNQKKLIPDPTWDAIYPTIYALLETNTLLIAACLQPLALLFPGVFPVTEAASADTETVEEEGKARASGEEVEAAGT